MKKLLYSLFLFFIIVSCEKEDWVEYPNSNDVSDITELSLFANSSELIANGKCSVSFLVKAYGEVQLVEYVETDVEGNYKDTLVTKTFEFKDGRLPEDAIKIYMEDGTELDGDSFSTTSDADSVGFYAEGGSVRSAVIKVALKPEPETDYEEITIPVIFHLISNSNNKYAIQNVTSEYLQGKLDHLNSVLAGTLASAPSTIDAKVKFELAETDPNGKVLEEKGIEHGDAGDLTGFELNDYVSANFIWDTDKYLNIYISDWYYSYWGFPYVTDFQSLPPKYITTDPAVLPNPKKIHDPYDYTVPALTQVDSMDVEYTSADEVGIIISTDGLFDQTNRYSFEYMVGTFFGVFPTRFYHWYYTPLTNGDTDFCSDTYIYYLYTITREKYIYEAESPTSTNAVQVTPKYYYNSYNIMDMYSGSTTISAQQVARLRTVLEYCPLRQFRK